MYLEYERKDVLSSEIKFVKEMYHVRDCNLYMHVK